MRHFYMFIILFLMDVIVANSNCNNGQIPERFNNILKAEGQTLICRVGEWDVAILRHNENYNASIIRGWDKIESSIIDFKMIDSVYGKGLIDSKSVIEWGFDKMPEEISSGVSDPYHYDIIYFNPTQQRILYIDTTQGLSKNNDVEERLNELKSIAFTIWIFSDSIQKIIKQK